MEQRLKSTVKFRQFLALIIIFIFDFGGFALSNYISHEQDGLAVLINISGRQRMLSQRIPLLLHEINFENKAEDEINEDLKNRIGLFLNSHLILKNEAINRDQNKEDLYPHYYNESGLNQMVDQFLSKIDLLQTLNSDVERANVLKNLTAFAKEDLLKSLDRAVKLFERHSSNLASLKNIIEIILVVLNTIALFLIYFLILKPLVIIIDQREAQLKIAKKKAEEDSRFKTMFLANMSHELRTPLNGVLGTADLMGSTHLDKEQQEYLEIINQSGKILLGVINNILDLTKLQAGAVELEKVTFSPDSLLYSIPKTFRYPLESRGLKFTVECDNLPLALVGDITRLSQILNNIIGNAIKFTESGGISMKSFYKEGKLNIKISDTGIGMSEEALSKIFDSFIQADASTTRKFGGTGLGLSITQELIRVMNGSIEVESKEGLGTTFSISLPFPFGDPSKIEKMAQGFDDGDIKIEEGTKVVMVVDDNDINRKLMTRILERFNITPIEADSGYSCMDILKKTPVDLILMDYHMPEINGVETTQKILEEFESPPPIIALTADVVEETKRQILEAGMKELIPKPVQRSDLKRILSTYLQIKINNT